MANQPEHVVADSTTARDIELFSHIEATLYTAVISDSLDEIGYSDQAM